jgi:pilin isopeptide linkage protein
VRKVLKGDVPSDAQEFTFTLERKTGPDGNLEQTSNNIVETIKLTTDNETTVAESEFHGITFKKPGEYIYTVREMKGNAKGYTYDDKVYNIKFLVEPDENDSEILRCTKQIILDGENEVSACEFVNNYEIMNMNDDDIKISETDKGTDESVVPPDTGDNLYTWIMYYVLSVILVNLFAFGFFNKNRYKKGSHQK